MAPYQGENHLKLLQAKIEVMPLHFLWLATTMSKACDGIKLAPVRLADLVKSGAAAAPAAPVVSKSQYVIPSKRVQPADASPQQATLSSEEMKSEESFPTLGPMKPATSGASWGQIRARLTKPPAAAAAAIPTLSATPVTPSPKTTMNFKQMIDQQLLREKEEAEKQQPEKQQPVDEEMEEDGWHTLSLQKKLEKLDAITPWDIETPQEIPIEEEWTGLAWPSDNTFLDGRTIDPSKPYTAPTNDPLDFIPYSPESLQRARNRMLAFIGKKPAA